MINHSKFNGVSPQMWADLVARVASLEAGNGARQMRSLKGHSLSFAEAIRDKVFKEFNILAPKEKTSVRRVVRPRSVAMYVTYYRVKDASQDAVARFYNKKSGSSVGKSVQQVQNMRDSDAVFDAKVQSLMDWAEKWKP